MEISDTEPKAAPQLPAIKQRMETLRDMLEKARMSMQAVIPKHVTPERLIKLALVAASRNPKLLQCTPVSVVQAVMQAAQLGLEFGGAMPEAHIIPYGDQATFQTDYRGLLSLARRSGDISLIGAWPVYAKDEFEYENTDAGQVLTHKPFLGDDPGPIKLVYAIARLKSTALPQIEIMRKKDVDHIRAKSKAANNGPWVTDYDQMARKTVLRRICNYIPRSLELSTALELEDRAERGEAVALDLDLTPALEEPESRVEGLKEQLKKEVPA
jgi:recombination protein RecT